MADDPSARLGRLPVLTEAELRAELADWNDTAADLPVQCIHEGFEARAAATPDAVAAEFERRAGLLRGAEPAGQPGRPAAAGARGRPGGARRRVHAYRAATAGGAAGHLEGRRRLRPAGPGTARGTAGVHDSNTFCCCCCCFFLLYSLSSCSTCASGVSGRITSS